LNPDFDVQSVACCHYTIPHRAWLPGPSIGKSVRQLCEHTFVPATRAAIAQLYASGLTIPAIARQLDLAPTTVSYHVERLARGINTQPSDTKAPPDGVGCEVPTRGQVATLLAAGVPRSEIARRLGISKATVGYHARRLGETIDSRCARRYDWEAVQRYYDDGHSVRDCMKAFGFSAASWFDAVNRGALIARPSATPIAELLVAGTERGRFNLKARLVREGLKRNMCERCGLIDWRGEPLTLALHHVNGQRHDNRLENLMLLCPNCHSQTENYAGRNGHRRERSV
jgi:DNA-binding CsgD family transcriptional regulator